MFAAISILPPRRVGTISARRLRASPTLSPRMKHTVPPRFLPLAAVDSTAVVTARAQAARALQVKGAGTRLASTSPTPCTHDQGTRSAPTNAQAVADITADFSVWAAVSTASLSFSNTGGTGVCANGQGCIAGTQCPDAS